MSRSIPILSSNEHLFSDKEEAEVNEKADLMAGMQDNEEIEDQVDDDEDEEDAMLYEEAATPYMDIRAVSSSGQQGRYKVFERNPGLNA